MSSASGYVPQQAENVVGFGVEWTPEGPRCSFAASSFSQTFEPAQFAEALDMLSLLESVEMLVTLGSLDQVAIAAEKAALPHPFTLDRKSGATVIRGHRRLMDMAQAAGFEPDTDGLWEWARTHTRDGVFNSFRDVPAPARTAQMIAEALRASSFAYICAGRPAKSMSGGSPQ